MRLTLRTLLAYLDDVLQPAQAHEIGEKINESSVATGIVSRIRDVMRRRRLTAPSLSGPGVGIDPNAVAEYIDGTLPPEAVADVEKICLESDIHLAEVASCHQILALALGEPVEIPANVRERMYALGPSAPRVSIAASPAAAEPAELDSFAVDSVLRQAPAVARPQPIGARGASPAESFQQTLPDYLRTGSSRGKVLGYAAVVLVLLAWGALIFYNSPFMPRATASRDPGREANDARPVDGAAEIAQRDDGAEPAADLSDDTDQTIAATAPAARNAGATERTAAPAAAASESADAGSDAPRPGELEELDASAPPYRKTARADAPGVQRPEPGAARQAASDSQKRETATPPSETKPFGKYVSSEGVALRFQAAEQGWYVMRPGTEVFPEMEIASPNPFETALELPEGLATLLPGTAVGLMAATGAAPAGLAIHRGEVLLRPVTSSRGAAKNFAITLLVQGELWRAELSPDAVFGVETAPPLPSRFEQEATATGGLAAFHVASGRATLLRMGRDEIAIELRGPASLSLPIPPRGGDQKWPRLETEFQSPVWMAPPKYTAATRTLATLFEKKFLGDQPVELTIPAAAADQNPRLSELATSCLGLLGEAGSLVGILQSTKHEESRQAAILGLREWLLYAEDNRQLLTDELARHYSESEGEIVNRLLWGFDSDDAQSKATSSQLIELMNHHEASIRALAFHHVKRLTGLNHGYHPNGSDLQLASALKQWRLHLNRNDGCLVKPKAKSKDQ